MWIYFFAKKCIPTIKGTETEHTAGHPIDNAMKANFEKLCKWLDEQTELFTGSELKRPKCSLFKMDEKAVRTTLPFEEPDLSKVVCFTDLASTIISEQWYKDRKENFNDAKARIITATTNFIKNEIRCIRYKINVYPSKADIEFVPNG